MFRNKKKKSWRGLIPRDVYKHKKENWMGLTSRMYTNKKNKSSRGDYTKGCLEIRKRKAGGGLHPEAIHLSDT